MTDRRDEDVALQCRERHALSAARRACPARAARHGFRWVCLGLLAGCAVDDRKLTVEPPLGVAGASAGAPSEDAWQGCANGGASGAADMRQCWGFDHDTEGFTAEPGIDRSFSRDDAGGDPDSGSLSVVNRDIGSDAQLQTAGAYVCLSVPYATRYSVQFDALVPPQPSVGGASIELEFINIPGCQGLILGQPQYAATKPFIWDHVKGSGAVPRGARSLIFRLLVGKFHGDPPFEARFDRVLLSFE